MKGGYSSSEAKDMIELCVDLNGTGMGDHPGPVEWECEKDPSPVAGWKCLFDGHGNGSEKGIPPFNNRWKLWKKEGAEKIFALAMRGTITDLKSVGQDLLATSLPAKEIAIPIKTGNKAIRFTLAETIGAEAHMGFTYGMAVLMFHKDQGILKHLAERPPGSQIYITGHSQGAAMATLAHAFLYHASHNDPGNVFGIKDKGFSFKSYVFAQPKPGNWQFAMDFASIQGNLGLAYAVNNTLDWVPQLPLSIQFVSETLNEIVSGPDGGKLDFGEVFHSPLHFAQQLREFYKDHKFDAIKHGMKILADARGSIAKKASDYVNEIGEVSEQFGYSTPGADKPVHGGQSLNYMPVGNVIAGIPPDTGSPPPGDLLWEHHAGRYREMVQNLVYIQ